MKPEEKAIEKISIALTDFEIMTIRGCLFREAMTHKELCEHYKGKDFHGIATMEAVEGFTLMRLREKFMLPYERVELEQLRKQVERKSNEAQK